MEIKIPKADKDGWFTGEVCRPPIGRVVEVGVSKAGAIEVFGSATFTGANWTKDGEVVEVPEFWRVKR